MEIVYHPVGTVCMLVLDDGGVGFAQGLRSFKPPTRMRELSFE